jgi:hypothetical protein
VAFGASVGEVIRFVVSGVSVENWWLLVLGGVIFVSAFVGAFLLRAAIHAANVVLPGKRERAVPLVSLDWSITLLIIANVLNLLVNWIVAWLITDQLDPAFRADKEFTQFLCGLAALPFNAVVIALVLRAGLPTTFFRAGLVVLFQVVFAVVFAIVAAVIALLIALGAQAAGDFDQKSVIIGSVIAGGIGALIGFALCLSWMEDSDERRADAQPAPAREPAHPPRSGAAEFSPGVDDGRGRRLAMALAILVVVLVVLSLKLPRVVP